MTKSLSTSGDTWVAGAVPWALEPTCRHGRRWSLQASRRFCLNLIGNRVEHVPLVLTLSGREQREALAAVYAFIRTADDFALAVEFEGQRQRLLDVWEGQLRLCRDGLAVHPVLIALGEAARTFDLPVESLCEVLDALRRDATVRRFETWDELLRHCRPAAEPVGRLVLKILKIDGPQPRRLSDSICTALRLTTHWQNISVDRFRDRITIPAEEMRRFGVTEQDLFAGRMSPGLEALVQFEVERTRDLYRAERHLVVHAGLPGMVFFSGLWLAGRSVLRMVGKAGGRILDVRPILNARTFTRALVGAGLERLPRMVA